MRGDEVAVLPRGEHAVRTGLGKHVGDALGRVVRGHGHVGAAGLEDGELGDDGRHRAVEQHAHAVACLDAEALQMPGEVAGAAVEFAVAHACVALGDGDGVGGCRRLAGEHRGHGQGRVHGCEGGVPAFELIGSVGLRLGADVAQGCVRALDQVMGCVGEGCEQLVDRRRVHQARGRVHVK